MWTGAVCCRGCSCRMSLSVDGPAVVVMLLRSSLLCRHCLRAVAVCLARSVAHLSRVPLRDAAVAPWVAAPPSSLVAVAGAALYYPVCCL